MINISEVIRKEKILFLSNINITGALDSEEKSIEDRISWVLNNPDQLYDVCSVNLQETNLENFVFGTFGIGITEGEIVRATSNDMGYSIQVEDIIMRNVPEIDSVEQFMKIMNERVSGYNDILIRKPSVSYLYIIEKLYFINENEIIDLANHFNLPVYYFRENNEPLMRYPEKKIVDIEYINSHHL